MSSSDGGLELQNFFRKRWEVSSMVDVFHWCQLRQMSTSFKAFCRKRWQKCFPTRVCLMLSIGVSTSADVFKFSTFFSEEVTKCFSKSSMLDVFPWCLLRQMSSCFHLWSSVGFSGEGGRGNKEAQQEGGGGIMVTVKRGCFQQRHCSRRFCHLCYLP